MGRLAIVLAAIAAIVPAAGAVGATHARTAARAELEQLAADGLQEAQSTWWNAGTGWYRGRPDEPVASTWTIFPLLEATAALAIAQPTDANEQRVDTLFRGAEGYWDPTLENGAGGVATTWGKRNTAHAFFDDAGWWGVAYLDAYRATRNARWLWDARRALAFIDKFGWDKISGGVWWDTAHSVKTSEPLAAATLIAATLYRIQHRKADLALAKRYIAWADAKTRNPRQGSLYGRNPHDGTVMDYVEGMMAAADAELCRATKQPSWCARAEAVAEASLKEFPYLANWAPETDVVYLRGIAELYEQNGNPQWYSMVLDNASRAAAHARDAQGLWSLRWDGGWTSPGMLYTQAATLELFAWASVLKPPAVD